MKLFTTPAITRDPDNYYAMTACPLPDSDPAQSVYAVRYWFCLTGLYSIFGLPRNVQKIWLEFYDRPGVDRWAITVKDNASSGDVYVIVDGVEHTVSGYTVRWLVKRLDRRECFVKCIYKADGPAPDRETYQDGVTYGNGVTPA